MTVLYDISMESINESEDTYCNYIMSRKKIIWQSYTTSRRANKQLDLKFKLAYYSPPTICTVIGKEAICYWCGPRLSEVYD